MLLLLITLVLVSLTVAASGLSPGLHHLYHDQDAFSPDAHVYTQQIPFDPLNTSIIEVQRLLAGRSITSVGLVEMYLDAIEADNRTGMNLRSVLSTPPREGVLAIAAKLDEERSAGLVRGDLHGVPILLKDNIATAPEMGMPTTAGSLALLDAVVRGNSEVVDRLIEAGAIILGKSAMSEFASWKVSGEHGGLDEWNAVGGLTSSAYVDGGYAAGGVPLGSSSGSAVSVSAGFVPVALGSDTTGSCELHPASRAALYAIRPTYGLVNTTDVVPISSHHDTVGPIAFTPYDAALLLQTIVAPHEHWVDLTQYTSAPHDDFSRYRIGIPDALFMHGSPNPQGELTACPGETLEAAQEAIARLAERGADIVMSTNPNLTLANIAELMHAMQTKLNWDGKVDLEAYLGRLKSSSVRTLVDLINFNDIHADEEMPPEGCCQERLIEGLALGPHDSVEYRNNARRLKELAGTKGLGYMFDTWDVDALMIPVEMGRLQTYCGAMGYPAASVPLGSCPNGLPFGMMFVVRPYDEPKLVGLMAAWEKAMPRRRLPEPLTRRRNSQI